MVVTTYTAVSSAKAKPFMGIKPPDCRAHVLPRRWLCSQVTAQIILGGSFATALCAIWGVDGLHVSVAETSLAKPQACLSRHLSLIFLGQTLGRWRGPS